MLWKYLHHLVREAKESSTPGTPYCIMLQDQFCSLTWKEFMAWRLEDSNQSTSSTSNTGHIYPARIQVQIHSKCLPTSSIQEKHQEGSVTIHNTQR